MDSTQGRLYHFCRPKQCAELLPLRAAEDRSCRHGRLKIEAATDLPPQAAEERGCRRIAAAWETPYRHMVCRPLQIAAPSTCLECWCLEPTLTLQGNYCVNHPVVHSQLLAVSG
ncbi:hypothetical protein UY3_06531 [Chelonia mydas]|uniref:Uncharacterized protein n=1 Tax=Chelonia mydas TaxID=8469 RepID=M7BEG9_CHEMY|nr:hypothetical protein UY3_06531 [Chelonia mydas]